MENETFTCSGEVGEVKKMVGMSFESCHMQPPTTNFASALTLLQVSRVTGTSNVSKD